MKILVTGAGAVLGQAIIKSIKAMKNNNLIEIIACDPNPKSVGLFWSQKSYQIPLAKEEKYLSEIYKILEVERPEFLLIGTDVELEVLSKVKSHIKKEYSCVVVVSEPKIIKIADDKWLTHKFFKENSFETPESYLSIDDFISNRSYKFPVILKPRIGARSKDVYLVKSLEELRDKFNKVDQPIIQEYLDSELEYTAGVLYFDKNLKASIVMERTLKDGNTFTARPIKYSSINQYLENLTEVLGVFGPVNYQFKIVDNKIKIFEINARFSGTTFFRALSNFNEVEMTINYLKNNLNYEQPEINVNISILRFYDELVIVDK
jgi:carbamoyl-phosphate synthase large subunit